jgi:hypothetical protein
LVTAYCLVDEKSLVPEWVFHQAETFPVSKVGVENRRRSRVLRSP